MKNINLQQEFSNVRNIRPNMTMTASSSAPFPSNLEKENQTRKKHRLPMQFRAKTDLEQEQDWNSTRRSVSAGAVLCSNNQQLSPGDNAFESIVQNDARAMEGNIEFFGSNHFFPDVQMTECLKYPFMEELNRSHQSVYMPCPIQAPVKQLHSKYFNLQEEQPRENEIWLGDPIHETTTGVQVTSHGFITVRLHSDVRVDITIDKAIRVISISKGIIVSLSSNGNSASVIHPSGRAYQYGGRVEVSTTDSHGNSKYAKIWHKGVSFTSQHCPVVYLVDAAGTRTTSDTFSDTTYGDISMPVFLQNSIHGPSVITECMRQLQQSEYWVAKDGTEYWTVNGIRISQTVDGLVRVIRGPGKYVVRISPLNQSATLTTPLLHATASVGIGRDCHVFVKVFEKRIHFDGLSYVVRNGTHSSGFDENNQLTVY